MRTLSPDTDPRAEAVMIDCFRRMSSAEKLARVFGLRAMTLELARARLREQYAGLSEHGERMHLASLWLDAETMRSAFAWDPDAEGY